MGDTRVKGTATGDERHAAHTESDPAAEAGMSRDGINIPDNVLLDGIKEYAEADQDDLLWLLNWGNKELGSRTRLCKALGADWSTIVRVCQGKYEADIQSFMKRVHDLQKRVSHGQRRLFVETVVTRKIFETLDYALAGDMDGGKMVMIVGHTRSGKTCAAQEWAARNNHGKSVFVDCPESGGLKALMKEVARSCRVNAERKMSDLRDRLLKSFNRRRILILDEILRELPTRGARSGPVAMEFVRRLHDVQRCAVALLVTPAFAEELNHGWLRDYLEQFVGRIEEPLLLPDKPLRSECLDIARAYRRDPPADLVGLMHQTANEQGRLGRLFYLMNQAKLLADKKREPLGERHLAAAVERRSRRFQWPEE